MIKLFLKIINDISVLERESATGIQIFRCFNRAMLANPACSKESIRAYKIDVLFNKANNLFVENSFRVRNSGK